MTPFVAVILYESTSDSKGFSVLYREDFVLIYAESEGDALRIATERAKGEECAYVNEYGETIHTTVKHMVDVNRATDDDLSAGGDLYSRHFRDYESYRKMEPLLGENPL